MIIENLLPCPRCHKPCEPLPEMPEHEGRTTIYAACEQHGVVLAVHLDSWAVVSGKSRMDWRVFNGHIVRDLGRVRR